MERCPLELWTKIASHACTDGGYTGCSLSLVSRTMYNAVDPVRYHSVSLIGNEQLVDFSARVTQLNRPPVIRHLFIADLHLNGTWRDKDRYRSRLDQRLRNIITLSAPNLVTLAIHDWLFNIAFDDVVYPYLHDLMMSGSNFPKAPGEEDTNLRFPSLRRLSVLPGITRPYDSPMPMQANESNYDFWLAIAGFASHVTHVRMFSTSLDGYSLQLFRVLLGIPLETNCYFNAADIRQANALASQLSALRYVFVQSERSIHLLCSHCATGIVDNIKEELVDIATTSKRVGSGQLILLPERGWNHPYSFQDAYADWCKAVDGGDGPWDASLSENLENYPSPPVRGRLGRRSRSHRSPSVSPRMPTRIMSRTPSRRYESPVVITRGSPSVVQPILPPRQSAEDLERRLTELASALTSLQRSIALGHEVHRLDRRLASATSARDLALSLQLVAPDAAVRADLQRRADQHAEAIAALERALSEAEGRLQEEHARAAEATRALAAAAAPTTEGPLPDASPVLECAPPAAPPEPEAGSSGQRTYSL